MATVSKFQAWQRIRGPTPHPAHRHRSELGPTHASRAGTGEVKEPNDHFWALGHQKSLGADAGSCSALATINDRRHNMEELQTNVQGLIPAAALGTPAAICTSGTPPAESEAGVWFLTRLDMPSTHSVAEILIEELLPWS